MTMKIATRDFGFTYDGERDEAIAGRTRVADDHELVALHPDCWRDSTPEDELRVELQVRTDRVRQLKRDAERAGGRHGDRDDWPASVLRQRDDDRFWTRMLDELAPVSDERDQGFDVVERFDVARAASWRDDLTEQWQGRIAE